MSEGIEVSTAAELTAAIGAPGAEIIIVRGTIGDASTLALLPGQEIRGEGVSAGIEFLPGKDGLSLSSQNSVRNLTLKVSPGFRAIFNDNSVRSLGNIAIEDVSACGQVQIITEEITTPGQVTVRNLDIPYADATGQQLQQQGFGVSVLQGVFTLWNRSAAAQITADLQGISIGRKERPAKGGGVLLGGFAEDMIDSLSVSQLTTGEIFTEGGIVPGQAGGTVFISMAVGVRWGAHVAAIENQGAVTTYGDFDMVLDNWGTVDSWVAKKPLTSYGRATAIGFVNYGRVGQLKVLAPIETFGTGSRGFNEYHGSIGSAEFSKIVTHGDAAPGIQLSRPVDSVVIHGDVETHGGSGKALVSGKFVMLPAYGISITEGAVIGEITIEGRVLTHGSYVPDATVGTTAPIPGLDISGTVGSLRIDGGIVATGS